jgi:hypothetical protein
VCVCVCVCVCVRVDPTGDGKNIHRGHSQRTERLTLAYVHMRNPLPQLNASRFPSEIARGYRGGWGGAFDPNAVVTEPVVSKVTDVRHHWQLDPVVREAMPTDWMKAACETSIDLYNNWSPDNQSMIKFDWWCAHPTFLLSQKREHKQPCVSERRFVWAFLSVLSVSERFWAFFLLRFFQLIDQTTGGGRRTTLGQTNRTSKQAGSLKLKNGCKRALLSNPFIIHVLSAELLRCFSGTFMYCVL